MAATTQFRICPATQSYVGGAQPPEPPLAAWPSVPDSPVVQYPKPSKRNGNGEPAGIVGKPWAEMGRRQITQAGLDFWMDLFPNDDVDYVKVKVKLYDQRRGAWRIYWGTLWRPQGFKTVPGRAYTFSDFHVSITDLVFSNAGWE